MVWHNFWDIMKVSKRLTFFTAGYEPERPSSFPFMVAAPRYLAGKIELGELMQISSAFGNVPGQLQLVYHRLPEPRLLARHLRSSAELPSGHDG